MEKSGSKRSLYISVSVGLLHLFSLQLPTLLTAQSLTLCKNAAHASKKWELYQKSSADKALKRKFDIHFYRLELTIDPEVNYLNGQLTTYFHHVSDTAMHLLFDLDNNMQVDSVLFRSQALNFKHSNNKILISLPVDPRFPLVDSVHIFYQGMPQSSGLGSFVQDSYNGQDSVIWTLSQPYGAPKWWPCKNTLTDKADSVEIVVTTTLPNQVASNGLLQRIDTNGTHTTYFWKTTYPIADYLVAIAIAPYERYDLKYSLGNDSLLMQHFLFPGQDLSNSNNAVLPFLHLFDSLFGTYPFIKEKYGHASFTAGGGMEHQTMSFMGSYGGELVVHELAHQWFGDKVTCASWQDLWLNEGFATYLEAITYEFDVIHSNLYYQRKLELQKAAAFSFPHGSVYKYDTTQLADLFNGLVYHKGAAVLHQLRWLVGDSIFFRACRNYLNDPQLAYGFASTEDFKRHMEKASSRKLDEYYKDWVYGKGYPEITTFWSQNGDQLQIQIEQDQTDPSVYFFNVPLPYRLLGPQLDSTIVIKPDFSNQLFNLAVSKQVDSIIFDPEGWVLAKHTMVTSLVNFPLADQAVKLQPNPATTHLTLILPEDVQLKRVHIYTLNGKLLNTYKEKQLSISTYPILKIEVDSGTISTSFVKK